MAPRSGWLPLNAGIYLEILRSHQISERTLLSIESSQYLNLKCHLKHSRKWLCKNKFLYWHQILFFLQTCQEECDSCNLEIRTSGITSSVPLFLRLTWTSWVVTRCLSRYHAILLRVINEISYDVRREQFRLLIFNKKIKPNLERLSAS